MVVTHLVHAFLGLVPDSVPAVGPVVDVIGGETGGLDDVSVRLGGETEPLADLCNAVVEVLGNGNILEEVTYDSESAVKSQLGSDTGH